VNTEIILDITATLSSKAAKQPLYKQQRTHEQSNYFRQKQVIQASAGNQYSNPHSQ